MKRIKESLARIDNYWFGHGSPVSLGVLRILIGFLALVNFLMVAIDFDAWFTERGYVPQAVAKVKMPMLTSTTNFFGLPVHLPFEVPRINLLWGVTDTRITLLVYTLTVIAAILTMLGLWTKVSTILLALGTVSIHLRNGMIIHGGDTVLRLMVLYLALSPCGLACSLDRVIGLWKGKISPAMPQVSLWVQKLIAFNVALVYFTTFWHKMRGDLWREGIATWFPARLNEFDRFYVPSFVDNPPFIYLTTYGTLITELAMGTLVFYKPARKWVLLAGVGMHMGIEYTMNIPLFAFMICSCYVVFYSGEEVSEWFARFGKRLSKWQVRIWTPKGQPMQPGPAAALNAINALDLITYTDGGGEDWEAKDAQDKDIPAVKASWTRSPAVWGIGWIPGLWKRILTSATQPASNSPKPESKRKAATS